MNIYILSGPVHSGKTTALLEFCKNRLNVGGILSPVLNGKRHFFDIEKQELFLMEATAGETNIIQTGKYVFSEAAFSRATEILKSCVSKNMELIIIDEIGPLELRGKGFSEILRHLLSHLQKTDILLVVRENIVDDVIEHFQLPINNIKIINTLQLPVTLK